MAKVNLITTENVTPAQLNDLKALLPGSEGGGSGRGVAEYSSWQVYATDEDIPAGTVSPYPIEIPCELDQDSGGNAISLQGYESTATCAAGKAYRAYDPVSQETKVVIATQSSKMKIPFVTAGWEDYWTVATPQSNPEYFIKYPNAVVSVEDGKAVGMTEGFCVRSSADAAHCDVRVDWGDGTVETVADSYVENVAVYTKSKDGEYEFNYYFSHTYAEPGYYDVKVLGRDYWGLRHQILTDNVEIVKPSNKDNSNIMCQAFTPKYRIASWVTNLSRFGINAHKLLSVRPPNYSNMLNMVNISYMFDGADNLMYAIGFAELSHARLSYDAQFMFKNCSSLRYTDMRLAPCTNVGKGWDFNGSECGMYSGCSSLRNCPASLLPGSGFASRWVSLSQAFANCSSMTMTETIFDGKKYAVDANRCKDAMGEFLWNDASRVFFGGSSLFSTASAAVRAAVPSSWGGTAS